MFFFTSIRTPTLTHKNHILHTIPIPSTKTKWFFLHNKIKHFFLFVFLLFVGFCLHAQTISFSFSSNTGNFCAPSTVRFIPVFSATPISYYWQLGLENEETEEFSPSQTYTVPGNYKVTLVALFPNKLLEVSQTLSIFGPASFSIIPSQSNLCKPDRVDFSIASSLPFTGLEWDFGDGSPKINQSSGTISHGFLSQGQFSVTFTAIDSRGCFGSSTVPISIQKPSAVLSDSPRLGCLPVTVDFNAEVSTLPGDFVKEYSWDFGDGSPIVSNLQKSMQYTYQQPNTYLPKLSIVTKDGCTNTYDFSSLSFGNPPGLPKVSTPKDTICASDLAVFSLKNSGGANQYIWEISNGDRLLTTDSVLQYDFNVFGSFQVKVTSVSNGCLGQSDSTNIFVRGLVAGFRFTNTCTNKNTFDFRNNTLGTVNSIFWDFGDGTTSALSRPLKTYPDTGSFRLKLIVRENIHGCVDSAMGVIYTAKPRLVPADSFVCRGQSASLGVMANYANPRVQISYSFLGRSFSNLPDSQVTMSALTAGVFNHRVVINNGTGYCRDTLIQPYSTRVSGPISSFALPTNTCLNESMAVSNLSYSGSAVDNLTSWSWDFGNNTTSNLALPPPVDYLASGNYRVSLKVTDNKGCVDSSFQTAKIRRLPLLRITPTSQRICLGQEIALTALHRSMLTWGPAGQVTCDTCATILVKPTVPTTYTAVAKDTFGCSRTQEVRLDIWYPFNLQPNVIRDTSICIGSSVPFDLKIIGKFVSWSPSAGLSDPTVTNPIATPLTTTTYTATVTDTGQCFIRTATATVRVNPYPQVDMGPELILPYNAPFTLSPVYGPDINRFQWVPSIGLSCTNCPFPSGRALASTNYSLIATTSQGCSEAFDVKITIECDEKNIMMPTGFTPNGDGLNDVFYPITRGMKTIKRFIVYNRYGQVIHEKRNFVPNEKFFGWDGTFNGKPQPVASYVYIVEAECDLGSSETKKGTISLLR